MSSIPTSLKSCARSSLALAHQGICTIILRPSWQVRRKRRTLREKRCSARSRYSSSESLERLAIRRHHRESVEHRRSPSPVEVHRSIGASSSSASVCSSEDIPGGTIDRVESSSKATRAAKNWRLAKTLVMSVVAFKMSTNGTKIADKLNQDGEGVPSSPSAASPSPLPTAPPSTKDRQLKRDASARWKTLRGLVGATSAFRASKTLTSR